MVGNDVVDLQDAESDIETLSSRWLQRVFTRDELHVLDAAADRPRMHWRLWAAKEAAYKWARQVRSSTVFSPQAFEVTLLDEFAGSEAEASASEAPIVGTCRGHVDWGDGRRVPLMLEEGEGFVHAWVTDRTLEAGLPRRGVARLPVLLGDDATGPSTFVRELVIQDARAILHANDLEIVRDGRIPQLKSSRGLESATLSLSHHGRFVAFAWWPAAMNPDDATALSTLPHVRPQAHVNEVHA